MLDIVLLNIEKIGFGIMLFAMAYVSNMLLGTWRNIKINKLRFDYTWTLESIVKFAVLGLGIALLSACISLIPYYAEYVGIEIETETLEAIDNIIIIGAFLFATIKYAIDGIGKLKEILKY